MKPKYTVHQKFETLGDPCRTTHTHQHAAWEAACKLRDEIAEMVAAMEIPSEPIKTGFASEIEAWTRAEKLAGVVRKGGVATWDSPKTYGLEAGRYIASKAVVWEDA